MRRFFTCCVLLLAAACLSATAANRNDITAVRTGAEALLAATLNGDYAYVVDHTYEGVVKEMGGRDAAIEFAESAMKKLKEDKFVIKSYQVGTPPDVVGDGPDHLFAIVPTRLEMNAPDAVIITRGYLLSLSLNGGKTWSYIDGSGLDDAAFRERVLPKLPADFKLPETSKPEITRIK